MSHTAAQPSAAASEASAKAGDLGSVRPVPYLSDRKIIKNGEMRLLVPDTDQAIDQVTTIVVDSGGYIISSKTAMQNNNKTATISLGVPVDQFELVQRRLRQLGQVLSDTAEGKDVTDEYVDLQSRLTNLEATAARVRDFLNKANSVEETLKVNGQLTEIEGQIEQVKGRMNYLKDRSAYSTLLVQIDPQRPAPTPTPTATARPTTTPVAWRPGQTFHSATGVLGDLGRTAGDAMIWIGVLGAPFLLVGILVVWAIRSQQRRQRTS